MSAQLDRIKKLLLTMYNSKSKGNDALSEGIRSISNFSGIDDLIRSVVIEASHYQALGRSADDFLIERCGINLYNDDVGAITGADAGGVLKTADSVVPEYSDERKWLSSDTTSDISSNLIIKWPADVIASMNAKRDSGAPGKAYTGVEIVVSGLYSWWIDESLKLVEESTCGSFAATEKTWTMTVNLTRNKSYLGQISWPSGNSFMLNLNMDYAGKANLDKSGYMKGYAKSLDRTVAHEMAHGVLAACLKDKYWNAPKWFIEGMAVLIEGGDDRWGKDIRTEASNPYELLAGLHSGRNYLGNNYEYVAGYITLRYLAHSAGSPAAGSTFVETRQAHYSADLTALVAVGNISGEVWLDNQHGTYFASSVRNIDAYNCSGHNNILAGNSADNVIISGSGSASLWGGSGGNDILYGGSGTDMFWYGKGEGYDTIQNSMSIDTVMLYNQMDFSSIGMSGNNLDIGIKTGGKLTIENWNENSSVNTFQLWDGSRWGLHKNESGGIDCYRK